MGTIPSGLNNGKARRKDEERGNVFINRKFYDYDFSDRDLVHADFRGATVVNCKFDNSDLSYANFEGANCFRSSFVQSKLYHTSFKDAVLAEVNMDPRDMFGMTISVSCDTFDRLKLGPIWLASWLFLPTLGVIPDPAREELKAVLTKMLGEERLKSLERIFANRQI